MSFGHDELIVSEFEALSQGKLQEAISAGKKHGCTWGISQAI